MKRKMLAVLLLVAIFAAFAGQVYAMTSGTNGTIIGEEPNVKVVRYITASETRYYGSSKYPDEIFVRRKGYYGYDYEGYIPVKSYDMDTAGGYHVTYEGLIEVVEN